MKKLITFDLDGTLIDSATSIANCINYILKLEGKETVNLEILTSMVGVGTEKMFESFNIICSKESYQNIWF
ncbi:HAD family hydrolase, partial [Bacillus thuringiensis]